MKKNILILSAFTLGLFVSAQNGENLKSTVPQGSSLSFNVASFVGCPNNLVSAPPVTGNAGLYGFAFDVIATNSIVINDFSINPYTYSTTGLTDSLYIFTYSTTYWGNVSGSLAGWTLQKKMEITGTNDNVIVPLNANLNIPVSAGTTMGVCFVITTANGNARFGNSSGGSGTSASNSDLDITTGSYIDSPFGSLSISAREWNPHTSVCYSAGASACAATTTFRLYGLNKLWSDAGANDPNMFYHGIAQGKNISANPSGGVGPYTYSWSNSEGYTMQHQSNNQIQLFEPLGPSWAICEITDVGAACTFKDSVFVDWTDEYYCGDASNFWKLKMCVNGANVCLPWGDAKDTLKASNGTLGDCPVPKSASATGLTGIRLYPNPANSVINVASVFDYASSATLEIVDLSGKLLQSNTVNIEEGVFEYGLQVSNLTNGMYMIRLSTDREVIVERFQVVK